MRRVIALIIELACGLLLMAIAFAGVRTLLQTPRLVYFFFPVLCTAAFAVGWWRRSSPLSVALTVILTSAPLLALALYFFSGRNKPLIALPVATAIFVAFGNLTGRRRAPRSAIAAAVVVFNVAVAFAGPYLVSFIVPSRTVKEPPIDFTLHMIDGRTIASKDLRGKIVVLDFWATWCVPCQHELPAVQRAWEKSKSPSDVAFFAVDGVMTDTPGDVGDTPERASAFFRRGGFTIPLAYDGGAVLEKAFALQGFPSLLLLDRDGRVRMRHTGFMGGEDLERTIAKKIDEIGRETSGT